MINKGRKLSAGQRGLWFIQKMNPESVAYNEQYLLLLKGRLDVALLERALEEIVWRHEILRTVFVEENGDVGQVVRPDVEDKLSVIEVPPACEAFADQWVRDEVEAVVRTPFELTSGPLYRFRLYRIGEERAFLALIIHHIVVDGLSLDVLMKEVTTLYAGETLPPLSVQYADYAERQQAELAQGLAEQEAYWLDRMAKPLPVFEPPTDYARSPVSNEQGGVVSHMLSEELVQRLRRTAQAYKTSPFIVLVSAYYAWVHRMTQATDMIVGVPLHGRMTAELREMIGYFVNVLPLRVTIAGTERFDELLQLVIDRMLEVVKHQTYPFDLLVEKVNPERDPSRSVLFSTTFNTLPLINFPWPGIEAELQLTKRPTARVDLGWAAWELGERIQIDVEYRKDLFNPETVQLFAMQYERVLSAALADLSTPIAALEMMSEADRMAYRQLNDTYAVLPEHPTIPRMFGDAVERFPQRTALAEGSMRLSYLELNQRANQVAHMLLAHGLRHGGRVALYLNHSIEMVIALLGVQKAGGAYVPIDPTYPEARNRYVIADSNAPLVLTTPQHRTGIRNLLGEGQEAPIVLSLDETLSSYPHTNPNVAVQPDDLAYVIYTSGSTGKPKGTLLAHRGVVNLATWMHCEFAMDQEDVVLQFSSFSFDAAVMETFPPLMCGGRLQLLPEAKRLSIEEVVGEIEMSGATYMLLPTVFFKQLTAYLTEEDLPRIHTMRHLMVGGEALPVETVRLWQRRVGTRVRIFNAYGPTEATVTTTCYAVPDELPEHLPSVPIGQPVANFELYVLDEQGRLCPAHRPGELHIGGIGLAQGYLNLPEKTAEAFVQHPFSSEPGARLYRTGDIVRLLPDGQIDYVGRKDSLLKIRGHRVEIGEIEAVLLQQSCLSEVAVIAKGQADRLRLVAYYLAAEGPQLPVEGLREVLGRALPAYMIPEVFIELERMPISPSGKIDRLALAAQEDVWSGPSKEHLKPVTEAERVLAEVWQEVLSVEQVGRDDDFFELGGHSIKVLQALAQLKHDFPGLKVQDFFEYRTLAALAIAAERSAELHQVEQTHVKCLLKEEAPMPWAVEVPTDTPRAILLTGATGYLGAYVLHELLQETDAHLYCLVRPAGELTVRERLEDTVRFYFGEGVVRQLGHRVTAVQGDLTLPGLGLSERDREQILGSAEAIIHCGADVRHFGDWEQFEQINVLGTERLLDLARSKRGMRFHHVSTINVAEWEALADSGQPFDNVYVESKAQAECLVRAAMAEGVPVTIYRAGNLVCHSQSGLFQRNMDSNTFYRVVKAILMLGMAPMMESDVDLTPIDYAARALVQAALLPRSVGHTLHLCNPEMISFSAFIGHLQQCGYDIALLPLAEYRAAMMHKQLSPELEMIMAQLEAEGYPSESATSFGCPGTQRLLASAPVTCPQPRLSLVRKLVKYAAEVGYLPLPKALLHSR